MAQRTVKADWARIAELRRKVGLTQAALAQKAGLARRTIERVESGQATLPRTLQCIAAALDVELVSIALQDQSVDIEAEIAADDSPIAGPITVYIDSHEYSPDEQGELLSLISELYSLQRHDRLVIDQKGIAESLIAAPVHPDDGGQT